MAVYTKVSEHSHEKIDIEHQNQTGKQSDSIDNSVSGIIKSITWPSFSRALHYAFYTMAASIVVGLCLFIYGYGINQLVAYLFG